MVVLNLDKNEKIDYLLVQDNLLKVGEIEPQFKKRISRIFKAGWEGKALINQRARIIPDMLKRLNGDVDIKGWKESDFVAFTKLILKKYHD